jgi:hypothetical protein
VTTIETTERTTVTTTKSTGTITNGMPESSAIGANTGQASIDPTWIGTEPQTPSEEPIGTGVMSIKSVTTATIADDHQVQSKLKQRRISFCASASCNFFRV